MKKILIVEDDLQTIILLKEIFNKILKIRDEYIIFSENGNKSFDIYTEKKDEIGLVLIDIVLPGEIDGYELTEKIRKISDVPIVIETAQALSDSVTKGYECGCTEYITKPFSLVLIKDTVKKYIEILN